MAATNESAWRFDRPPRWSSRTLGEKSGAGNAKDFPGEKSEENTAEDEPFIRCRRCLQNITRPSDRISRDGAHRHTFANSNGAVYEIGCFTDVTGCGYAGVPTYEFTWFTGYRWRVVFCRMCLTHLGWVFEAPRQDSFHGLILDHLDLPA